MYSFKTKNNLKKIGSLLLLCIPMMMGSTFTRPKPLNILFLMSDQQRGDALGAAGATYLQTPNLDKLAREGVIFTRAYSSVPSCTPARACLLTGMSPWQNGLLGYKPIANSYPTTGPALFSLAGYRTHAVGKNHFSPMRNKHGYQTVELEEGWYTAQKGQEKCDYTLYFEKNAPQQDINASGLGYTDHRGGRWFPFEDRLHPTFWTANRAIEFLKTYINDAPWLLKVSFQRPHPPFDPPKRWLDAYQDSVIPMPQIGEWAEKKYGHLKGSLEKTPSASSGVFPIQEIVQARRSYYASISYIDEQIGLIIEALKKRGELENTLIIYTSDHGDMMGDNHIWRKCRPYEGSARIPMILRFPESMGIKNSKNQIRTELVELRDIFPTFLDAAGIPKPTVMDGKSMLTIFKGQKWRTTLDLEHSQVYEPDNAWTALTDSRYKYIYFTLTGQEQLFDLKKDPNEQNDLALTMAKNSLLMRQWRAKMVNHLKIRGEGWVKNGQLVVQKESIHYSVNFPK